MFSSRFFNRLCASQWFFVSITRCFRLSLFSTKSFSFNFEKIFRRLNVTIMNERRWINCLWSRVNRARKRYCWSLEWFCKDRDFCDSKNKLISLFWCILRLTLFCSLLETLMLNVYCDLFAFSFSFVIIWIRRENSFAMFSFFE